MRGKKKDSEFLSNFITECIGNHKNSPEEIVAEAKVRISNIDSKIKEVENLKAVRSKLLDVIGTFEQPSKAASTREIKALSFFKIQYPAICKQICDTLKTCNVHITWLYEKFTPQDVIFCIKQLIEMKIISKTGDCLFRGEMFEDYLKFVLQER